MVLPLYLAVTGSEMPAISGLSQQIAYMACHFSPYTQGLTNIPRQLPPGTMLILNDRMSCCGHSADLVTDQLREIMEQQGCDCLLLDFQRPPETEASTIVRKIVQSLPFPVAATEAFAKDLSCPVFLSPAPLHMPLSEYLEPWRGREIWLEAALEQELITVRETGVEFNQQFPPDNLEGGFYDDKLCCHYQPSLTNNQITFTLFDTPQSLEQKLELAQSLGVTRTVGLWQELGNR